MIFGKKMPTSLSKTSRVWLLLRGITLWSIWLERDDLTFNSTRSVVENTQQVIWQCLLEYPRIAWDPMKNDVYKVAIYDDSPSNYDKV